MFSIQQELSHLTRFLGVSCLLTLVIFSLAFLLKPVIPTFEKLSAYECGFQPFRIAHLSFAVSYYLIALLFIIFDIELVFCLPIIYVVNTGLTSTVFLTVRAVITILVRGFVYEWKNRILEIILV
jgi:NADH-quinone oxidoreductase subunit A